MTTTPIDETKLQEDSLELMNHLNGLATALGIHYGGRAGLFDALRDHGPGTSAELAEHTGLSERWVREWLYQQASAGVIEHEDGERFSLSPEGAVILADESTPASMVGFFAGVPSMVRSFEHLPAAFETGQGQPYDGHGDEGAAWIERATEPWNAVLLNDAFPALDGVVAKLESGAQAADVGCGAGARTVGMAQAFPKTTWRGFDNSLHALRRAQENLAAAPVTNLSFHNPDDDPLPSDHSLDLVTFCDVVHDMAFPDRVLAAVHAALKPDGTVLVVDFAQPEALVEKFEHPGAPLFYGFSLGYCMSSGLSEEGGAGLGPFGLPASRLRQLAEAAGFTRFHQTEVADPFNAYYEIRP